MRDWRGDATDGEAVVHREARVRIRHAVVTATNLSRMKRALIRLPDIRAVDTLYVKGAAAVSTMLLDLEV